MKQAEDRLRPMVRADLEMVLAWRNSDEVRRFMYNQKKITAEEHRRWFEISSKDADRILLVYERCHEPCGFVSLTRTVHKNVADWGFYLRPSAPRGSGRRLGQLGLSRAFSELGLHKVCGEVLAYNHRSTRFHERLGFLREGVLRQHHYKDDAYHDVYRFGLLAAEWAQRQKDEVWT